jgi:hypothetical protein
MDIESRRADNRRDNRNRNRSMNMSVTKPSHSNSNSNSNRTFGTSSTAACIVVANHDGIKGTSVKIFNTRRLTAVYCWFEFWVRVDNHSRLRYHTLDLRNIAKMMNGLHGSCGAWPRSPHHPLDLLRLLLVEKHPMSNLLHLRPKPIVSASRIRDCLLAAAIPMPPIATFTKYRALQGARRSRSNTAAATVCCSCWYQAFVVVQTPAKAPIQLQLKRRTLPVLVSKKRPRPSCPAVIARMWMSTSYSRARLHVHSQIIPIIWTIWWPRERRRITKSPWKNIDYRKQRGRREGGRCAVNGSILTVSGGDNIVTLMYGSRVLTGLEAGGCSGTASTVEKVP